jgi:hypothetical protein
LASALKAIVLSSLMQLFDDLFCALHNTNKVDLNIGNSNARMTVFLEDPTSLQKVCSFDNFNVISIPLNASDLFETNAGSKSFTV